MNRHLTCPNSNTHDEFEAMKTYYHQVVMDASGEILRGRPNTDDETEKLEITCLTCHAPAIDTSTANDSGSHKNPKVPSNTDPLDEPEDIEGCLRIVEDQREAVMRLAASSRVLSMQQAEEIAVAACALSDATAEIRYTLEHYGL